MNARIRVSLVALATLLALAGCGPGEAGTPKVLAIGIDGVRPDVLAEVPTPHLDALAADGTFTDAALTGFPSVSGPGWSSLLTGVWPGKHGVTNNDFTGKRYDVYPDFLTRIEQVRPELRTFAVAEVHIVDVAVTALVHLGIRPAKAWDLDGRPVGLR